MEFKSKKYQCYKQRQSTRTTQKSGEKAFYDAKNKFYAEFHNLPFDNFELQNPDLYIDEIDWNPKIDSNLLEELGFALLMKKKETDLVQVRTLIEEIVPSGWDVDDDVYKNGLTGLIVGDHTNSGEGAKVSHP
ncbi:hypothetical protein RDI58_027323 [Solanum bulbocastanum]|uniref:Uncharacterized protein n=1 Tax=Solanum bulbocastanum TaxID=147425 RepID=A0AAN8Y297_SOLBU